MSATSKLVGFSAVDQEQEEEGLPQGWDPARRRYLMRYVVAILTIAGVICVAAGVRIATARSRANDFQAAPVAPLQGTPLSVAPLQGTPAPVVPSPVAPSPVAPSPVAPSPIAHALSPDNPQLAPTPSPAAPPEAPTKVSANSATKAPTAEPAAAPRARQPAPSPVRSQPRSSAIVHAAPF